MGYEEEGIPRPLGESKSSIPMYSLNVQGVTSYTFNAYEVNCRYEEGGACPSLNIKKFYDSAVDPNINLYNSITVWIRRGISDTWKKIFYGRIQDKIYSEQSRDNMVEYYAIQGERFNSETVTVAQGSYALKV